ncbi:TPA: hypothetical protein LTW91_005099 [Enterobacter hormaechei]|nr:hypothetical protein [Enterobacter hormaechei]HBL9021898.1 hypothetical protein [Enterobacter hormaechei]
MQKFLYLTKSDWEEPWINGGDIPLFVASTYRSLERGATLTPDENVIDNSTHSISLLRNLLGVREDFVGEIIIDDCTCDDGPLPNMHIKRTFEDGLVLCLANRRSRFIAKKLKKSSCVVINDVNYLKNIIDEQIGFKGMMGACNYSKHHARDHFTKSFEDAWQDEFRMFWKNAGNITITLPKGIASLCFRR